MASVAKLFILLSGALLIAIKTGSIGIHSGNVERQSNAPAYWIAVSTTGFMAFVSLLLFLRKIFG